MEKPTYCLTLVGLDLGFWGERESDFQGFDSSLLGASIG